MPELLDARLLGVEVIAGDCYRERFLGRISPDSTMPADLVFGGGFREARLADLVRNLCALGCGCVLALLLLPAATLLMALAAVARGRPICVRELRVGWGDRPFALCVPSSTWAGRLLTRLRLHRLPALWNLLCGELSLVGPAPLQPEVATVLARRVPHFALRHRVRPGLWSWGGLPRRAADPGEPLDPGCELYYLRHRSLRLDLAILWGALGAGRRSAQRSRGAVALRHPAHGLRRDRA
jgi:lipopolysaccharide/colanic/teichoic acid biosynthesis glycosyltransferase